MSQNLPVILIGPMGSGKSAIGQRLASMLKRQFIDTDTQIEARCGVDIGYIFEKEGEAGFRTRETLELQRAIEQSDTVIATGGGIVTQPENVEILKQGCFVIYLETSPEQQYERVRHANTRPLLETSDPKAKLLELTEQRSPIYESLADLKINTDGQKVTQITKTISRQLEQRNPSSEHSMNTLMVELGNRSYQITIKPNSLDQTEQWQQIAKQCGLPDKVFVITDDVVAPLYLEQLTEGLAPRSVEKPHSARR